MSVELGPILEADLQAVGRFLQENLNQRVNSAAWVNALQVPWSVSAPNHGYMLKDGDQVVGAYLAYYSERMIDSRVERFCNLGAWCVLEAYRSQGVRLLLSLLRQRGYHLTDFSPSGNVIPLNRKLKFIDLPTTTALMPNVPWPKSRHAVITGDPLLLEKVLTGADETIYRDHREAAAARHLLLVRGQESCYVIFRKDSRKGVRAFASILHVGNRQLFRRMIRSVGSHLLLRHGAVGTLLDQHVVGEGVAGSVRLAPSRPKMYKSETLTPNQIDYLYSELTCLEW